MTTTIMNIDLTRINAEITKHAERLEQMRAFTQDRYWKLKRAADAIEALLAKHKCNLVKMDNAYSGGHGPEEYGNLVPMHVTCHAIITEGIKNTDLYTKRLIAAWQDIGQAYGIRINSVYVNGKSVEIHILVN